MFSKAAMTMLEALCAVVFLLFMSIQPSPAQGIYMLNGRATPSVIVGADGGIFPVIPNPCHGGPCPVILAPPLPWRAPPRFYVPPPYAQRNVYGPPPPPCDCSPY
jgi:hypothetical protein